jgi:RNA polymerase sigma-70 factor (ECF subfamily)
MHRGAEAAREGALAAARRSEDPDAVLVAAAKKGNAAAFEELISRNERRIFRLAQNITQNHEDAEDVVQNSLVNVFRHLDSFHGESRFSTWLTRVVVNQALMLLRKRRPGQFSLDNLIETEDDYVAREIVDWGPTPEQRYSEKELQDILSRALAQLTPANRVVFQLRDVEQFSTEETAKALGISIAAVKSRTMRARLELRERLNKFFGRRKRPTAMRNALAPQAAMAC